MRCGSVVLFADTCALPLAGFVAVLELLGYGASPPPAAALGLLENHWASELAPGSNADWSWRPLASLGGRGRSTGRAGRTRGPG